MSLKSPLSPLEQEVMNVVWAKGSATAAEIRSALPADKPLQDSTVRTLLTRLEKKGYLTHRQEGRTFVYSSLSPARSLATRAVKQIIDRFCQGSMKSLLVGLVDEQITDTAELRRIVDGLDKTGKPKKTSKRKARKNDV